MFSNLTQQSAQPPQSLQSSQVAPEAPTAGLPQGTQSMAVAAGDTGYDESIKQELDDQMNRIDDEKKMLVARALVDYQEFPSAIGAILGQEAEDYFLEKQGQLAAPEQDSAAIPAQSIGAPAPTSPTQAEDTPVPKMFG